MFLNEKMIAIVDVNSELTDDKKIDFNQNLYAVFNVFRNTHTIKMIDIPNSLDFNNPNVKLSPNTTNHFGIKLLPHGVKPILPNSRHLVAGLVSD